MALKQKGGEVSGDAKKRRRVGFANIGMKFGGNHLTSPSDLSFVFLSQDFLLFSWNFANIYIARQILFCLLRIKPVENYRS